MREFKSRKKQEEPETQVESQKDITQNIKNFFDDHHKRVLLITATCVVAFIVCFGSLAFHFLRTTQIEETIQQDVVAEVETEGEIIKITSDEGLMTSDDETETAALKETESASETVTSDGGTGVSSAGTHKITTYDKSIQRETAAPDESVYESRGENGTQVETRVNVTALSEDLKNAKLDVVSDGGTTQTYLLVDGDGTKESTVSDRDAKDDAGDIKDAKQKENVETAEVPEASETTSETKTSETKVETSETKVTETNAAETKVIETDASEGKDRETAAADTKSDKTSTISLPFDKKKMTVMVYMVGSSLETKSHLAADSIVSMLSANVNTDDINIVIETGGTKDFHNISTADQKFDESKIERWYADGTKLKYLGQAGSADSVSMTDEATFESFLKFVKDNFPASRYEAVLWGQSGGPLNGFGYDEVNTSGGQLTLTELTTALGNADINLDMLLFDARLMGAMETGYALAPHVDYMIASEDNEYSIGLNYTNLFKKLSEDPEMSVVNQGKVLIDDFISTNKGKGEGKDVMVGTYSVIDLKALKRNTAEKLKTLAELLKDAEKTEDGRDHLRQASKEAYKFAKAYNYDLIDVCSFLEAIESNYTGNGKEGIDYGEIRSAASALKNSIIGTIGVSRYVTPKDDGGIYGLTIYFPQTDTEAEKKKNMVSKYETISFSSAYQQLVKQYTE